MSRRWWLAAGWAVLIEGLLLWPSPPDLTRTLHFANADKVTHAGLFAVQALLVARALMADGRRPWPALAGTILFGLLTELQQTLVPSRSMELGDLAADSVGALVGLALAVSLALRRREFQR